MNCELSLGSSDQKDPLCVACTLGNIVNKQNNNFLQQVYATLCLHVSRCNNGLLQQTFVIKSMILACKQFLIHFFFFCVSEGHMCATVRIIIFVATWGQHNKIKI